MCSLFIMAFEKKSFILIMSIDCLKSIMLTMTIRISLCIRSILSLLELPRVGGNILTHIDRGPIASHLRILPLGWFSTNEKKGFMNQRDFIMERTNLLFCKPIPLFEKGCVKCYFLVLYHGQLGKRSPLRSTLLKKFLLHCELRSPHPLCSVISLNYDHV